MRSWLLMLAVLAEFGCSRQPEQLPLPPPPPPAKMPVNQARIAELERKIEGLRKQRAELESVYERQVMARHPNWPPDKQKQQLAVLRLKWEGSNRTREDDTVYEMRGFGSRVWHSELVDDDYRDMHRAKSAQWRIDDEIKVANGQLDHLRGGW